MATQPVEDIDAVLGRFQAWTGAREATGRRAGVRELSDEEALASGRYRWKSERATTAKPVTAPLKPANAPVAAAAPAAREQAKANAAKSIEPKRDVRKRKSDETTKVKLSVRRKEKELPAFRELLAEAVLPAKAVRPAEVIVKPQPVELSRQVAISIRLAPSERALIKTRAAEAGITASAYIRQCALEVEQLREQVRKAVAAMERGGNSTPTQVVSPVPAKGLFAWMARKFLPRKMPALALRA